MALSRTKEAIAHAVKCCSDCLEMAAHADLFHHKLEQLFLWSLHFLHGRVKLSAR
jgi:hypothetical protein